MDYLSSEEILLIHHQLIERFSGSHGVRDLNRIRSVAIAPAQEVFGKEQYIGIFNKAAVYIRNIVIDHPFIDGNKRTAISCAVMFLKKNNHIFRANLGEIEDFMVKMVVNKLEVLEIAEWLKDHSS